jgi:hypothetical protein
MRRTTVTGDIPLLGDRDGGESTSVESIVRATDGQLSARVGELEGEDRLGSLAGLDEGLEDRGCIVLGDGLEAHAHQTYETTVSFDDTAARKSVIDHRRGTGCSGIRPSTCSPHPESASSRSGQRS